MATQIVMGGYGPATTTHSRALKIIGERLAATRLATPAFDPQGLRMRG